MRLCLSVVVVATSRCLLICIFSDNCVVTITDASKVLIYEMLRLLNEKQPLDMCTCPYYHFVSFVKYLMYKFLFIKANFVTFLGSNSRHKSIIYQMLDLILHRVYSEPLLQVKVMNFIDGSL